MSIEKIKFELVNDLISLSTVMEEVWKYHPDNPKMIDIKEEYKNLEEIKLDIERQLEKFKVV